MVDKDTQERWDQEDRAKYLKRAGRAMRLAQSKAWARGENPSGYTSVRRTAGSDGRPLGEQGKPLDPLWDRMPTQRRRPDSYRSQQIKGRDDV